MRWSLVPERLRDNPHFRKRMRIIDRVSLKAAIASAVLALALSFLLGDRAWLVLVYAAMPIVALAFASVAVVLVRVRMVGVLSKIPRSSIPLWAQHLARTWWMVRVGLAGAMMCLVILLVISVIAGAYGEQVLLALMFVVLMSMTGTGLVSIATDVVIIAHNRAARAS